MCYLFTCCLIKGSVLEPTSARLSVNIYETLREPKIPISFSLIYAELIAEFRRLQISIGKR